MKRLLAAMLALMIFACSFVALAEFDEENPFAFFDDSEDEEIEFDYDPFEAYLYGFEVDPFAQFIEDDDVQYAYAFGSGFPFLSDDDTFGGNDSSDSALPPASATGSGSLSAEIGGEALTLSFDASPAFSNITDDMVQAAFYTYGDATGNFYEMFLTFPNSIRAGETITPEYAMQYAQDTSVMLLVSDAQEDHYYIASQLNNGVFPETSSYTLRFDNITASGDSITYAGTVSANMVSFNVNTGSIGDSVNITDARFEFTMSSASQDTQPDDGSDDADPQNPFTDFPDIAPSAMPTMAPDYRKV